MRTVWSANALEVLQAELAAVLFVQAVLVQNMKVLAEQLMPPLVLVEKPELAVAYRKARLAQQDVLLV